MTMGLLELLFLLAAWVLVPLGRSISQMAWSHGLLNGVGFTLGGLLGWKSARVERTL